LGKYYRLNPDVAWFKTGTPETPDLPYEEKGSVYDIQGVAGAGYSSGGVYRGGYGGKGVHMNI